MHHMISTSTALVAALVLPAAWQPSPTPAAQASPFASAATLPCTSGSGTAAPDSCTRAAQLARRAALLDVSEEYLKTLAACVNITDPSERAECYEEAAEARDEELELVAEQFDARMTLCDLLGSAPYDPEIDPDDFTSNITNPFFPQVAGMTLVYESEEDGEIERIEVSLQAFTREILGVECAVVRDLASVDGVPVEDTLDYYAQDKLGNVWYFGEISLNFDDDGNIEDIDGSWISGEDFAEPGIVMQAAPAVGQVYRQEFLLDEAEDVGAVIALNQSVSVPFGDFDGCLKTQDSTPLEPDALEEKFYAPGVGFVLAIDVETGKREELVDIF